jgi:hypothetical protein
VKVTINGEQFEYERRMTLKDALAIEEESGRSYTEWEQMLGAGRAWAGAVLAWLLWRRAGRHVPLADLLPGPDGEDPEVELDYGEMMGSIFAGVALEMREEAAAGEAAKADPTPAAGAAPDGTPMTSPATRRSSPRSST